MFRVSPLVVALAATTMLTSAALAAEQTGKASASDGVKSSAATQTANQDFGKLSADGFKAFRNVRLARLAIFDGHTDQAKKFIDEARTAIAKAKADDTAFLKDEASLKPPAGMSQKAAQTGTDKVAPSKTPTAWLPVDGSLTLGEDFVATPTKAAGVAKANEQLKKGDHKQAMETLKLSEINVAFVMEVAPLDKTISGIDNAAQLIDSGKYYEGNQALKGVEDGLRLDVADINARPKTASDGSGKSDTQALAKGGNANLTFNTSPKDHNRIREIFAKEPAEVKVDHVGFSLSPGTVVPNSVHLALLPQTMVDIEPTWRGNKYFQVGDQIVIVDTQTMKILGVLDA